MILAAIPRKTLEVLSETQSEPQNQRGRNQRRYIVLGRARHRAFHGESLKKSFRPTRRPTKPKRKE